MIIARAGKDETELLILGLSRTNVARLVSGQPIHIRRETHGDGVPDGWEILIVFGENERAIQVDFEKQGLIGPETQIHRDPRL
jgi:hypothetical protein